MKCKRFADSPSILSIVYYRVDYRELLYGSSLDFYLQKIKTYCYKYGIIRYTLSKKEETI